MIKFSVTYFVVALAISGCWVGRAHLPKEVEITSEALTSVTSEITTPDVQTTVSTTATTTRPPVTRTTTIAPPVIGILSF
jgi:hypothetical protein